MKYHNSPTDDLEPISSRLASLQRIIEASTLPASNGDAHISPPERDRGIPGEFGQAERKLVPASLPGAPANVFIFGGNGVGKSFAAAALAREWHGSWCDVTRLPMRVRASRSFTSEETEERIFEKLGGPSVLVLDDLWAISAIPGGLEWILAALNVRRRPGYSTIVTSHATLAEIDKVSGHIGSRLGAFQVIKLTGKDRRFQK